MVQKELTLHNEEGEIVQEPADKEESAEPVVEGYGCYRAHAVSIQSR